MPDAKLTPREMLFVTQYLVDLNCTQAAIRAGYSEKTAGQQGHRVLSRPRVKAAIDKAMAERAVRVAAVARVEITADRVLQEIADMAFWDPADVVREIITGPADIIKLPEHVRRAVIGWGWDRFGHFTLKFSDKKGALELLGKHLGIFQADRLNDEDKQDLLRLVIWRFVSALHLTKGMPLAEALRYAEGHQEEVDDWGRAVGLVKTGAPAA